MLITKNNPVGIDKEIQNLQVYLYNKLNQLGITDHNSYGRAYKNERNGKLIPEIFINKTEYEECLYNDKFAVTSFYLVGDTTNIDERSSNTVSLIFQLNLKEVLPLVEHRADEEFINLIVSTIERSPFNNPINVIRGMSNVYQGFDVESIKYTDMQDFMCVRFDIDMTYDYTCKFNSLNFSNVDNNYINFASNLNEFVIVFSKEKLATNQFLKQATSFSNDVPIIFPFNCVLVGIYASGGENQTWDASVYLDDVYLTNAKAYVTNDKSGQLENANLLIEGFKRISVYVNGEEIEKPKVFLHLKRV